MNSKEYLIAELAQTEMWRIGCERLFGEEVEKLDELPQKIMIIGRREMYKDNFLSEPYGVCDTFEEYCEHRVLTHRSQMFTKELLIKIFEKELRADYEAFKSSKAD